MSARQRLPSVVWLGWVGVVVLGLFPALLRDAHTDEAWPLYLAGRLLEGAQHGVDFFEMNPPLFIWLSLPAVFLSKLSGLSEWHTWVVTVAGLIGLSLLLAVRQTHRLESRADRRAGLMLVIGFVALVLPRLWFSEREHLALVLALPFALLVAHRLEGMLLSGTEAAASGVLGAVGFSLKPHFLVAWLLLEVFLIVRVGRRTFRRPELWALISTGMIYFILVLILAPGYFPMAFRLAPIYNTYLNNGLVGALILAGPWLLLIAGIGLGSRIAAPTGDSLRDVFTVLFLGFFLGAILQQKGLSYHYLAAWGFGLLMLVRCWQIRPERLSWYPSGILLRLSMVVVVVIVLRQAALAVQEAIHPGHERYDANPRQDELVRVTRELAAGRPIMVLSTNPVGGWPLTLSAGAEWASRYMHFWPLAAIYDEQLWRRPAQMVTPTPFDQRSGIERKFHNEIIEDLERYRPQLVLVLSPDLTQWGMGGARRFDYLEYFSSDPRFRDFMSNYVRHSEVGSYQVWTRTGP